MQSRTLPLGRDLSRWTSWWAEYGVVAVAFAGYWVFFAATLLAVYTLAWRFDVRVAVFSSLVDTVSLTLVWLVAVAAAAKLPLTGRFALRNFAVLLVAAVAVLVLRIFMLRSVMMPMGWFTGLSLMDSIQRMVPRNLLTFAVLWVGGWALVHYRRVAQWERRAAAIQAHLVHARLTTLMSRLQPHFIGNTLHAVSYLVYDAPGAARRMLDNLRSVIAGAADTSSTHEVLLRDELMFIDKWLELQAQRFSDTMSYDIVADGEAEKAWVPRLVLQPLVENCVIHAVGNSRKQVHIEVRAVVEDAKVNICVDDNGPGLQSHMLRKEEGVGLSNTRERLAVLYGDTASMSVKGRVGGGVSALIRLPYLLKPILHHEEGRRDARPLTDSVRSIGLPDPQPTSATVAILALAIMLGLFVAEFMLPLTTGQGVAMTVEEAVGTALLRIGSVILPAALAFWLPGSFPATSWRNVSAAVCILAITTAATLIAREALLAVLTSEPMQTLSATALQGVHVGTLMVNVLAGGYVARYIGSREEVAATLRVAEATMVQARQRRVAASLETEAVFAAFDRIEAAIDVDADTANREIARLSRRLSASLRAAGAPT